ncbi:MAG TPA: SPASM domain-containing protein, partial [Candidatus Mucispirillum faecigallinarum]|nr:SPASM domain-containing protein [Candidatus Mucispirillum faecigallinarum]
QINEEIMHNSNTEKITAAIQKLCRLRDEYVPNASITIQMTFMRANIDSIIPIVEKAIEWGVNRVKGHQLWITHKELENEALYNDSYYIEKWNKLVHKLQVYQDKIKLENFLPITSREYVDGDCPFLGNELWINYKGDISVCCAPDYERRKLGGFGNIYTNSLHSVLTSKQYKDLCVNYKQNDVCKKCLMRR